MEESIVKVNSSSIGNNRIYQSNKVIEASYGVQLNAFKFHRLLASMINKNDKDFKCYEFRIKDLAKLFNLKGDSAYKSISEAARTLMSKIVTIQIDEKKYRQYPLLAMVEYNLGTGIIRAQIHPDLKPYYFEIEENYTKYEISNILGMKSPVSMQLYEILKMNKNKYHKGDVIYDLEELRFILNATEKSYNEYKEFNSKILKRAQREINTKTDITFEYEGLKYGGSVASIKFIIHSKNKISIPLLDDKYFEKAAENSLDDMQISIEDIINTQEHLQEKAVEIVCNFEKKYKCALDVELTKKLIGVKGIEHVMQCVNNYSSVIKGRNIRNMGGDFYTYVTRGYEKTSQYASKNIIPQHLNFEQREYSKEELDSFYVNIPMKKTGGK